MHFTYIGEKNLTNFVTMSEISICRKGLIFTSLLHSVEKISAISWTSYYLMLPSYIFLLLTHLLFPERTLLHIDRPSLHLFYFILLFYFTLFFILMLLFYLYPIMILLIQINQGSKHTQLHPYLPVFPQLCGIG